MVAEIIGGIVSGSLALLADAGHMAIDVMAIALSLFAAWVARMPPSPAKTYGYYRAEILAALINGASLVAVSLWIFYEAWNRVHSPHAIDSRLMGGVAFGGLLINVVGLILVHRESKENLNLKSVWLHLVTDTLGSVASLAAAVGVALGWTRVDPIVSMAIALLILYGSWKLLSECVNVLLEGVPRGINTASLRGRIESLDGVEGVHDLHVWCVSSGVNAMSAHLRVHEGVDHKVVLDLVIAILRNEFQIEHVTLQLEPPAFKHEEDHHLHA